VLHSNALHGNPYDGHTLDPVIADLEKLTGVAVPPHSPRDTLPRRRRARDRPSDAPQLPQEGDRINAVLVGAGYNFSLLLRWFAELLRALLLIRAQAVSAPPLRLNRARKTSFTADDGSSTGSDALVALDSNLLLNNVIAANHLASGFIVSRMVCSTHASQQIVSWSIV
jgi:hypothetical protein